MLDRHPALAVEGARIHALRGFSADAERWLAAAEQRGADDPSLVPQLATLRAAMCRDGAATMLSDAGSAVASLTEDSQWRALALLVFAAAHLMLGDNERADAIFDEASAFAARLGFDEVQILATSERMLIAEEACDYAQADKHAAEVTGFLAGGRLDGSAPCAIEFAAAARSHLRHGNWEEARALLTRARQLTPFLTEAIPWLSVQTRLELARTFLALRDVVSARALLSEVDDIFGFRPDLGVLAQQTETLRTSLDGVPVLRHGKDSGLTAAEMRLLPFLTTHLSFREIGERLYLSRNTIKTQAISVYRKLDVSTRSDAIEQAVKLGLVDETLHSGTLVHTG